MMKELKIEWGLSSQEFDKESEEELLTILAYREYKSLGEQANNQKTTK